MGTLLCIVGCAAAKAVAASPTQSNASIGKARVTLIAEGLEHPWAMAWLPPTARSATLRALVTERAGRIRIVNMDGKIGAPLNGVPNVHTLNQGGLV